MREKGQVRAVTLTHSEFRPLSWCPLTPLSLSLFILLPLFLSPWLEQSKRLAVYLAFFAHEQSHLLLFLQTWTQTCTSLSHALRVVHPYPSQVTATPHGNKELSRNGYHRQRMISSLLVHVSTHGLCRQRPPLKVQLKISPLRRESISHHSRQTRAMSVSTELSIQNRDVFSKEHPISQRALSK